MTGTSVLQDAMADLIGADTATLAEATPFVAVFLVMNDFAEDPSLEMGDLTPATFATSTELHAASAATQVTIDPATGDNLIQVREPAGGWHWVVTATTNLPQTIYGFGLADSGLTDLYGAERFEEPIELNAVGQSIDIGQVRFRLAAGSLI